MANPRHEVTGPTFAPIPFGIPSVATVVDDADPHWRNGIKWEAGCSPVASTTLSPCAVVVDPEGDPGDTIAADPPAKTPETDGAPWDEGDGFTLYAMHQCSAIGRTTQDDRDRAARLLTNGEARALDTVIITGVTDAGTLPNAIAPAATTVGAEDGSDIVAALGSLEETLGTEYGGLGVIYLPRSLVLAGFAASVLVVANGRITTVLCTPVAQIAGTALDDAVGGLIPVYGTGALTLYRGGVNPIEGFDHTVNRNTAIAERDYAFGWDCLAIEALVATSTILLPSE